MYYELEKRTCVTCKQKTFKVLPSSKQIWCGTECYYKGLPKTDENKRKAAKRTWDQLNEMHFAESKWNYEGED